MHTTKRLNDETREEERPRTPCENLWLAVLIQAIREACGEDGREKDQAIMWLTKRRTHKNIGDVSWVCEQTRFRALFVVLHTIKHGTEEQKLALKKALT